MKTKLYAADSLDHLLPIEAVPLNELCTIVYNI